LTNGDVHFLSTFPFRFPKTKKPTVTNGDVHFLSTFPFRFPKAKKPTEVDFSKAMRYNRIQGKTS